VRIFIQHFTWQFSRESAKETKYVVRSHTDLIYIFITAARLTADQQCVRKGSVFRMVELWNLTFITAPKTLTKKISFQL